MTVDDRYSLFIVIAVLLATAHCDMSGFRSVQRLNAYFQTFFAQNQSITSEQWFKALPTVNERLEMKKLIKEVFAAKNYGTQCSSSLIDKYPSLRTFLNVTLFKNNYCVIHELIPANDRGMFKRFWGYAVISNVSQRPIHHSAAHFQSDGYVCDEAAAVFQQSAGRSLVIAGANRYAVIGDEHNKCQNWTSLADAAHNAETMFETMNEAVFEAASTQHHNVFIQWHGMAETSCSQVQAFISAGASGTSHVYEDPKLPANRMVRHFNELSRGAFTPATTEQCKLLATTNVFGRYVNGVLADQVCSNKADPKNIRGAFVHVEQKRAVRDNWDLWEKVIRASFPSSAIRTHPVGLATLAVIMAMNM